MSPWAAALLGALASLTLALLLAWWLLGRRQAELTRLHEERVRLQTQLEAERQGTAAQGELQTRFRDAFQALSAEALRDNHQSFQHSIEGLVKPVRESLDKVEQQLQAVENKREGAYAGLQTQVAQMMEDQRRLQRETGNLVTALRAAPVRGRWGEIQLRRVVELAGLLSHCDFFEQASKATEDGRMRPDLLVRLPGGKNVVVDAKAPLGAYLEAVECADEERRAERLRAHGKAVRDHMGRLGAKSYWDQFQPAPEFVVMFLPGETFFGAALQVDPALIEFGVDQKVIPASPTTLIALLRAIAYGWQQERQTEGARAVAELGRVLYKRLCVTARHLADLGKHLDQSTAAYNQAVGSLERQVFAAARRFKDLGAGTSDELLEPKPAEESARCLQAADLSLPPPDDESPPS